jgi:hypothetical protein
MMSRTSEDRRLAEAVQGALLLGIIASCIVSSAVASIADSCASNVESRCSDACGPRGVARVTTAECVCREAR